jgi:hypothetical protein
LSDRGQQRPGRDRPDRISTLEDCIKECEWIGEIWTKTRALNSLGWVYSRLEDHETATRYNQAGLDAGRELNDSEIVAWRGATPRRRWPTPTSAWSWPKGPTP